MSEEDASADGERPEITQERLIEALMQLRPLQREVFLLAARDKLSYAEIADRKWISVRRVQRVFTRALINLDRIICAMEERDRSG